jgi:hypothetical protein
VSATAPSAITIYQWSAVGMATPTGTCTLPATNCYQAVQTVSVPNGVVIWNAQAGADVAGGMTPAQATTLTFDVNFRPDGSSTGGTVFLTDNQSTSFYRVLVYTATGSSYARQGW